MSWFLGHEMRLRSILCCLYVEEIVGILFLKELKLSIFGGFWEAAVKSHFRKFVGSHILSFMEPFRLVTQIEAVLNIRFLFVLLIRLLIVLLLLVVIYVLVDF